MPINIIYYFLNLNSVYFRRLYICRENPKFIHFSVSNLLKMNKIAFLFINFGQNNPIDKANYNRNEGRMNEIKANDQQINFANPLAGHHPNCR